MTTQPNPVPHAPTYTVPSELMHAMLGTLAGLPWSQINGVIAPAVMLVNEQDAAAAASGSAA